VDNPEVKATTVPQYVRIQLPTDMASYPRKKRILNYTAVKPSTSFGIPSSSDFKHHYSS